ncbi:MAG TPA: biopolymer transporter ExbD [Bacteroidia bacterium]|jgi:biopolymer transport protein ExbD|nr:biopolymer transporter ExbD [Bacteroidia bacterium]
MKIKRDDKFAAHIEASSMNDIMFFLLLFFLIVSTLVNPSVVKLTLPSSKKVMEMNKQQITLEVSKDLRYYLSPGKDSIPADKLEEAIKARVAGLDQPTIFLHLDKSLTVQDLVDMLQIGSDLKIKMMLATKPNS